MRLISTSSPYVPNLFSFVTFQKHDTWGWMPRSSPATWHAALAHSNQADQAPYIEPSRQGYQQVLGLFTEALTKPCKKQICCYFYRNSLAEKQGTLSESTDLNFSQVPNISQSQQKTSLQLR